MPSWLHSGVTLQFASCCLTVQKTRTSSHSAMRTACAAMSARGRPSTPMHTPSPSQIFTFGTLQRAITALGSPVWYSSRRWGGRDHGWGKALVCSAVFSFCNATLASIQMQFRIPAFNSETTRSSGALFLPSWLSAAVGAHPIVQVMLSTLA